MNNEKMSLDKIIKVLVKNIIIIIIFALIGGGSFYLIAKHKQSTSYTAERNLVINHRLDKNRSKSQLDTDLNMVPTYRDMIEDRNVITDAYHRLPSKMRKNVNVKDVSNSISTNSRPGSLVISVKANTGSPEESVAYANSVVEAAKAKLPDMQNGIGTVHIYSKATSKNVEVITHNSTKKHTLVGLALGIIAGMIIAFARTSFEDIK